MQKIMHADCDCFYAAVEMRDQPSLRNIPIAVGGRPEQRGVIATCNYPARKFGIHSAMSSAHALRLCPHLHLIRPDFERYRRVSADIMGIFQQLTPLIEPLSLDEAYLDITGATHFQGSGTWMAQWLKEEVYRQTGITISVGVAPNKFLAKIASDWKKPDVLFVIPPQNVESFITELPVEKLPGVGPATAQRLNQMNVHDGEALKACALPDLIERFGKFGHRLYQLARGIDTREVKVERERKSISVENTFDHDITLEQAKQGPLEELMLKLDERIQRHGNPPSHKVFVKIRFDDFTSTTLECSGMAPTRENYSALFDQAWLRHSRPMRLMGVGIRLTAPDNNRQLILFDDDLSPSA